VGDLLKDAKRTLKKAASKSWICDLADLQARQTLDHFIVARLRHPPASWYLLGARAPGGVERSNTGVCTTARVLRVLCFFLSAGHAPAGVAESGHADARAGRTTVRLVAAPCLLHSVLPLTVCIQWSYESCPA
jgi:hypothetical protein